MKYVNGAFTLVNAKQSKEPVFPLLTFTNFEPKLHFRADLSAKGTLNPRGFEKL
jgi:hypothetical protein